MIIAIIIFITIIILFEIHNIFLEKYVKHLYKHQSLVSILIVDLNKIKHIAYLQ